MKRVDNVWIKLDACDIKVALQQSMKGDWNGDADLGDGQLEALRHLHQARLQCFIEASSGSKEQLDQVRRNFEEDTLFIKDGLQSAIKAYQKKIKGNSNEHTILAHCWDVAEYNLLQQQCQHFSDVCTSVVGCSCNCDKYKDFMKGLFKRKRTAATHILVVLASDELRNHKPYCVPLQYIPCTVVRDEFVRRTVASAVEKLAAIGVTVVGTVTDGEYATLR